MSPAIEALFIAEHARFNAILKRARVAAEQTTPSPTAIWIQGPVATGNDTDSDPLVVGMLSDSRDLRQSVASVEDALGDLERELDVSIEIRGRTHADLLAATPREFEELRMAIPLLGAPPSAILEARAAGRTKAVAEGTFTHQELDEHALKVATSIAEMIRADPAIVDRARDHLARQLESPSTAQDRTIREWERILRTTSLPRLRRLRVDRGERATRLRQSIPFLAVLSDEERQALAAKPRRVSRKTR